MKVYELLWKVSPSSSLMRKEKNRIVTSRLVVEVHTYYSIVSTQVEQHEWRKIILWYDRRRRSTTITRVTIPPYILYIRVVVSNNNTIGWLDLVGDLNVLLHLFSPPPHHSDVEWIYLLADSTTTYTTIHSFKTTNSIFLVTSIQIMTTALYLFHFWCQTKSIHT